MDRDIYNLILEKISDIGTLISGISGDTSEIEEALGTLSTTVETLGTTVGTIEGDVTTLKSDVSTLKDHDTITSVITNNFAGFTDSSTGIFIKINPTNNRLVVNNGTTEYYYTLTPYST